MTTTNPFKLASHHLLDGKSPAKANMTPFICLALKLVMGQHNLTKDELGIDPVDRVNRLLGHITFGVWLFNHTPLVVREIKPEIIQGYRHRILDELATEFDGGPKFELTVEWFNAQTFEDTIEAN